MNENNMKIREEGYFNYLANEMISSVIKAEDYTCKDFVALKLELIINLHKLFESKDSFEEAIKMLIKKDKNYEYNLRNK